MDITYYDSGYIDPNYYVYTADAVMGLGTFIAEDYLEPDYFENTGIAITLTCDAIKITIVPASADLVANFSQSVNGVIDVRAEVTLSTIVSLSSQEIRLREFNLDCTSTLTQTTSASATFSPQLSFSSIASQLVVAFQNATGTITMETVVTVTAIIGVIRQFPLNQITGLGANSEQYGRIEFDQSFFPPPVGSAPNLSVRKNNWTFSVWVKRDTINGAFQCIAEGLVTAQSGDTPNNNGGIVLKNDDVRIRFNYDPDEGGAQWNNVAPTDTEWHHYLFRSRTNSTNETFPADTWDLWIDGLYKNTALYQAAGDLEFAGRYNSNEGTLYGGLRLGYGLIAGDEGNYGIAGAPLLGGVAQVWMGSTTDDQFRVERFYSGLLDMGDAGTSTGLPTPVFYNKLTQPYTGVTWASETPPVPRLASTPLTLPSLPAPFTLTVESVTVLEVTANLQSVSSLTVTASRNLNISADITVSATLEIAYTRERFVSADLSTASSLSADINVTRSDSATLTASASMDCVNTRVRTSDVTVTAESTLTATIGEITEFTASLESQFTQTTEISRTRIVSATAESVSTVTAQIDDRIRDQSAALTSAATVTVTATRIPSISAALTSEFTLVGEAEKFVIGQGVLSVVFTQTTAAFKVVFAQASLVVEGFQLTQGDILNFDPCREIKVDQETRISSVTAESRLFIVDSETRTLKVPQETRVLRVEYETRVNITQC